VSLLSGYSGRQAAQAFQRAGWTARELGRKQRTVGSHNIVLTKPAMRVPLVIPDHRELRPGTLRKLIRHSGLTVEQFIELAR
jgi:predicted RNA binding protein YcfA (HicA-like mRNA interferase family)